MTNDSGTFSIIDSRMHVGKKEAALLLRNKFYFIVITDGTIPFKHLYPTSLKYSALHGLYIFFWVKGRKFFKKISDKGTPRTRTH